MNTSGKTIITRLYIKFLTSISILLGNRFIKTLESRLINNRITRAKKYIETLIIINKDIFFFNKAY